jgi:multidrug transporter EmrE-like cation transporter
MNFVLLIILLSLVEFVGDSNFKNYARTNTFKNLIIGVIAYIFVVKILIESFKQRNLIFTNAMWDAISTLISTLLAVFILREHLNNWQQWVGLFSIVFGILLLNYGKAPTS